MDNFPHLSCVTLTGGEPLLHPRINTIYRRLYEAFLKKRLHDIHIATNASSTAFPAFLKRHRRFLAPLSLSISIDGNGRLHDLQRGTRGAFLRTIKNIRLARAHNIPVTIKFVASPWNYQELPQVAALAQDLGCLFIFKLIERVPNYYHRHRAARPPLLRQAQLKELAHIIRDLPPKETPSPLEALTLQGHKKYFERGDLGFIRHCLTPRKSLFITSHGDVYNCLYQKKIGTLAGWPESIAADRALDNIAKGARGKCPKCLSYHGSLKTFQQTLIG
jgi:MoaA/NifB/PqqE/SkfB family radical SAM enzyme